MTFERQVNCMVDNKKKGIKPRKIIKGFGIGLLVVIICIVVGVTGFTVFYLSSTNGMSNYLNVNAIPPSKDGIVNILVAGVDVGAKDNSNLSDSNSDVTSVATNINNTKYDNSIFLFSFDTKNKKLKIISIPRDTMFKANSNMNTLKYADSVDGPKYLVNTVEALYNIKINYYAGFTYAGFKNVIDALGGVDLNINNNMNYDDNVQNLHIHFTKGSTVHMNGSDAENYFRWVKNNNDQTVSFSNEVTRIKDEEDLVKQVMSKFKRLSTIFKYPEIISTVSKSVETNMSAGDIIGYARTFAGLNSSDISYSIAKGYDVKIQDKKYYLFDSVNNKKYVSSSVSTSVATVNKAATNVYVWNGTNKNGLAMNYKNILNEKGFTSVTASNPPASVKKPVSETQIQFYNMDENKLVEICNDFGNAFKMNNIELVPKKSTGKADVIVTLGTDAINN